MNFNLNWSLFAAAFGAIFIAELGDKTQLATLSLSAGGDGRGSVFLGAALALVLSTAIAVLGGELVARVISPLWLTRISGIVFIVLGAWTLWGTRHT